MQFIMKTLLRNFLSVFRRFQMATLLNVAGLTVAFAAFLIIMMQIEYERNFDRCHPTADRVVRLDRVRGADDKFAPILSRAFADAVFQSSPHIEKSTLILTTWYPFYFKVGEGEKRRGFQETFGLCYPEIVDVFDFTILEGDKYCLRNPDMAMIPESLAKRMFDDASAIGQHIITTHNLGESTSMTVGAVYKDFPKNTQLENYIYLPLDDFGKEDWHTQCFIGYMLLDKPESRQAVEENFNRIFNFKEHYNNEDMHISLVPLTDIYYRPTSLSDYIKSGDPSTVHLLFLIALLVILVAGINFTNFSTSLAPIRMRSINTQKVLGSSVSELRLALVSEAVCISILACLLAFLLVYVLNELQWLSFVEADTLLRNHIGLMGILLVVSAGIGLVAGLYPAWYMTSFSPALVLKGNFGLSKSGRRMRTVLIGFQYIISIGLIIGAMFIQLQNRHMREFNLGFDKDQIAIVELNPEMAMLHKDAYSAKLKEYPEIEDVAFSSLLVGGKDSYMMQSMKYGDKEYYTYMLSVSWNFLRVMGIEVTEGRDFTEADAKRDTVTTFIYNRSARERIQMEAGHEISGSMRGYIAGFTDDVRVVSFRLGGEEADVAFIVNHDPKPVSYIRLRAGANAEEAVNHIHEALASIDPAYPADIRFYDSVFDQLYHKEQYLKNIISLFGLLAIILSIVGVFGLVFFETQYRRKEIGIRKVYGASIGEILVMFNLIYLRIVLICFVIAAPVAWYGVNKWLENFSSRTPVYWWTFPLAFLMIALVTAATVTFQNWQAATENPVESIHIE